MFYTDTYYAQGETESLNTYRYSEVKSTGTTQKLLQKRNEAIFNQIKENIQFVQSVSLSFITAQIKSLCCMLGVGYMTVRHAMI